jgi:hypothetical protein
MNEAVHVAQIGALLVCLCSLVYLHLTVPYLSVERGEGAGHSSSCGRHRARRDVSLATGLSNELSNEYLPLTVSRVRFVRCVRPCRG